MTIATKTHTPGPWKLGRGSSITAKWENGEEIQVCSLSTTQFCGGTDESYRNNHRMHDETEANGPMIAAAPEMLAALEAAEHWMRTNITDGAGLVFNQMLAAIRKARGEQ